MIMDKYNAGSKVSSAKKVTGSEDFREQIGMLRDIRDRYESGIIRATSQQGDRLYCIVQRIPKVGTDGKLEEQGVGEKYFGNEDGASWDDFVLAEALIETDIDLSGTVYDPDDWMGREVLVWTVRGIPERVLVQSMLSKPRAIHPDHIKMARALSPDKKLSSRDASKTLQSLGYSEEQVEATINENMEVVDPIGMHITYGNTAVWGLKVVAKGSVDMADSLEAGIVTNVSSGLLGNKLCYKPAKVFTAR